MTRSLRSSDHDALALICAIAQTRDARITSAALSNHHPAAGAQLQALGVLTRVGDEAAATSLADHEDTPVALVRSPDGRSFGYFSPQAGWVAASPDDQSVFAVSFETLLPKLLDGLDCPLVSRPVQLLPGLLWEVGGARLPGRSARVPVWIGRRLSDPATWALLLQQFQQRPSPGLRIVLSLTAEAKLPKTYVSGHEIIAVRSVIDASDGFRIDPQILAARLAHGRDDGHHIAALEAEAGVPVVTRILAELAGHELVPLGTFKTEDPHIHLARIIKDAGEVSIAISQALADGRISPAEARTLKREAGGAIEAMHGFVAQMNSIIEEGGSRNG